MRGARPDENILVLKPKNDRRCAQPSRFITIPNAKDVGQVVDALLFLLIDLLFFCCIVFIHLHLAISNRWSSSVFSLRTILWERVP